MICTARLGCDLGTSVAAQECCCLHGQRCIVQQCFAVVWRHELWHDPSCHTLQQHEGSVVPGAHSRNVSRELQESSEGARVAILLAADDVEGDVAEQGPVEQSAAEQSGAEQSGAELSAATLSADPPQLLPASDGMDADPSSGASKAAQGGASCQDAD